MDRRITDQPDMILLYALQVAVVISLATAGIALGMARLTQTQKKPPPWGKGGGGSGGRRWSNKTERRLAQPRPTRHYPKGV